jgi:3-oxoacyl-(acyl-carrier-protein) synthase III
MSLGIVATGSYLPSSRIRNDALADRLGVEESWIVRKTKILERRAAAPDEATSDSAARAGAQAIARAGLDPSGIGLLVVGTSTPDSPQPSTAALVQHRLGLTNAVAFDVNAVCSGFVYALDIARAMLVAGRSSRALVIGADTYTRVVDYDDRRTAVLLGDGAGAVVLGSVAPDRGLLATRLRTDGEFHDYVKVPAGGSRLPVTEDVLAEREHLFKMRGRDVAAYVREVFPALLDELLDDAGIDRSMLRAVVPHQANGRLLDTVAAENGLPDGIVHTTVEKYGNTGAASVPITLHDVVCGGGLRDGDYVALLAFGGGMTAGGAIVRWTGEGGRSAA